MALYIMLQIMPYALHSYQIPQIRDIYSYLCKKPHWNTGCIEQI